MSSMLSHPVQSNSTKFSNFEKESGRVHNRSHFLIHRIFNVFGSSDGNSRNLLHLFKSNFSIVLGKLLGIFEISLLCMLSSRRPLGNGIFTMFFAPHGSSFEISRAHKSLYRLSFLMAIRKCLMSETSRTMERIYKMISVGNESIFEPEGYILDTVPLLGFRELKK